MNCNDWKSVQIKDLGDIVSGGTPKTKEENYWGDEISWITPKDMSNIKKKYISRGERSITKLGLEKSSAKLMPEGSVLFTSRAPIGYVGIAKNEVATNQGFKSIVVNSENNNEFVYYLLKYLKPSIENVAGGSTFKEISGTAFKEIKTKVPPISEQERIASILKSLDDKIELNNQMNQTLEEMAQSIFKEWFVEFNFPNEEGVPYKDNGGEMVESELGEIPEGWRVEEASKVFNINIGKTPPRKEKECFSFDDNDIKWLSIKDMGDAGAFILNTSEYLTEEAIEKYNVKVVPKDTVVLSFKLTVGRLGITNEDMVTNEAIAHFNIKNNKKITKEYIYSYLKIFNYESLGSTSSIAKAVNSKVIKSMPIVLPDNKILADFTEKVINIFEMIRKKQEETNNLIKTRDILLPKLMSGEVRV